MSGKVLTAGNCSFKCPNLSGKIRIIELQILSGHNNNKILTDKTKLVCAGTCTALQGALCPNPLNTVNWLPGSFENNVSINGAKVLNSNAKKICPTCAGMITCSVEGPAISAGLRMPSVSAPSKHEISSETANAPTQANETTASEKTAASPESPDNDIRNNENIDASDNGSNISCQNNDIRNDNSDGSEEIETKNAICDFDSCPKKDECQYLKASPKLLKKEGVVYDNGAMKDASVPPASILRRNAKDAEKIYEEKDEELQKNARMKWTNAAHHIISIKAAFANRPKIVKLAHFYGYDINCRENCIFLPTLPSERNKPEDSKEHFGQQDDKYKQIRASEVMDITKKQWHVSNHDYGNSISMAAKEEIMKKEGRNAESYNVLVNDKVSDVLSDFLDYIQDNCNGCAYDSFGSMKYDENAGIFTDMMNSLSDEIRKYLDAFAAPQKSFPYFVSNQALEYAYLLPRTGKIVCAVFDTSTGNRGWKLERYQYTKYKKDDNEVRLEKQESFVTDYYMESNKEDIINLFLNARHIFIFDKYEKINLPFSYCCTTYYIHSEDEVCEIYSDKGILIRKLMVENKLKSRTIIPELMPVVEVVLKEDMQSDYISPMEMIKERKKECGLL